MNIAIVGATGNVGRKLLEVIEKLNFKFSELYLIASDKSAGKKIKFQGKEYTVLGITVVLFFAMIFITSSTIGDQVGERIVPEDISLSVH